MLDFFKITMLTFLVLPGLFEPLVQAQVTDNGLSSANTDFFKYSPDCGPAAYISRAFIIRCHNEIQYWSKELDELEEELHQDIDRFQHHFHLERSQLAVTYSNKAQRAYWSLLEVPNRYLKITDTMKLSEQLPIPYPNSLVLVALREKRWEALRPMLLPLLKAQDIPQPIQTTHDLGWSSPDRDDPTWANPENRIYEWFLLMQLLNSPPAKQTPFNMAWIQEEVGTKFLLDYLKSTHPNTYTFFHNQYEYFALPAVSIKRLHLPTRVKSLVDQMAWQIGEDKGDFKDFMFRKDHILSELLDHILAGECQEEVSICWLSTAGRWYPFFTALEPQWEGEEQCMKALKRRSQLKHPLNNPAKLIQHLWSQNQQTAGVIMDAIFWYQFERMKPHEWVTPTKGWSGWVPENSTGQSDNGGKQVSYNPPAAEKKMTMKEDVSELTDQELVQQEQAWRKICLWASQCLSEQDLDSEQSILIKVVHKLNTWCLAFGEDELVYILRKNPSLHDRIFPYGSMGKTADAVFCEVKLIDLIPHNSVTVSLEIGQENCHTKTIRIPGPWKQWFAVCTKPNAWMWLLIGLGIFVLALMLWLAYKRGAGKETLLAIIISVLGCVAGMFLMIYFGPIPQASHQIGGVVQLTIPGDASVTPGLQQLFKEFATALYREFLYAETVPNEHEKSDIVSPNPFVVYWGALRSMWPPGFYLQTEDEVVELKPDISHLDELEILVRTIAWKDCRQIIRCFVNHEGLGTFRRALESIEYRGEPDFPSISKSLCTPAAFEVLLHDGDHGGLTYENTASHSLTQRASIFITPMPTRDLHEERGLTADMRWQRLSKSRGPLTTTKSKAVDHKKSNAKNRVYLHWVPKLAKETQPGIVKLLEKDTLRIEEIAILSKLMDRDAAEPHDLSKKRQRWWGDPDKDVKEIRKKAQRIASLAYKDFINSREKTSYTILRLPNQPLRPIILMLVTAAILIPPLWLQREGILSWRSLAMLFSRYVVFYGIVLILVLSVVLSLLVTNPRITCYGPSMMTCFRHSVWTVLMFIFILTVTILLWWTWERHYWRKRYRVHFKRVTSTGCLYHCPIVYRYRYWVMQLIGVIMLCIAMPCWFCAPFVIAGTAKGQLPTSFMGSIEWGFAIALLATLFLWTWPHPKKNV